MTISDWTKVAVQRAHAFDQLSQFFNPTTLYFFLELNIKNPKKKNLFFENFCEKRAPIFV